MTTRRAPMLVLAIVLWFGTQVLAAVATAAPAGAAAERLVIAIPAPNAFYWDTFVAIEKRYFAEQGFNPEITFTRSSQASVQQLAAGGVEMGAGSPDVAILAAQAGADVVIAVGTLLQMPMSLIARPEIKDFAALKGKTIGVSALKGGEITLLRYLLRKYGLRDADYSVIVAGATPQKLAAVKSGAIGASVLFQPTDFMAVDEGLTLLGQTAELPQQYPSPVYSIRRKWASENDHGVRLGRAMVAAHRWLTDAANKKEAIEILQKRANVPSKYAAQTYDLFLQTRPRLYSEDGSFEIKGLLNVMEIMAEDGDLRRPLPPPQRFVDFTFIQKAGAAKP